MSPIPSTDGPAPRIAGPDDVEAVTDLFVDAFARDALWARWAFEDPGTRRARRRAVFRIFVDGAAAHRFTWLDAAGTSATMWIPPGRPDLTREHEAALEDLLDGGNRTDARRIRQAFDVFAKTRPSEPHYYLSLFGTHPDAAGRGAGQRLLAANLDLVDAERAIAALDTGDDLVPFYERFGFRPVGAFALPDGGPTVRAMRREPRALH